MNDSTKYVGMDVSKEKIAVAVADGASRESARYWGEIPHRIEDICVIRSIRPRDPF